MNGIVCEMEAEIGNPGTEVSIYFLSLRHGLQDLNCKRNQGRGEGACIIA